MLGRLLLCCLGWHARGNFCIHCGAQLHPRPFAIYRVSSRDGRLNEFVRAANAEHAKWQFRRVWHPGNLQAVRVAGRSSGAELGRQGG